MDEELQKELKALRRGLLINRILNGVLLGVMLILLICGIRVVKLVTPVIDDVKQISATMEKLESLDLATLMEDVNSIDAQLSSVDWTKVADKIDAIDMQAFNEGLNTIKDIDVEQFGKAIENLNSIMTALKSLPFF